MTFGANEQSEAISSCLALLVGCACAFPWEQAAGASAKCPPLMNHSPAMAAFSDQGAKALSLEISWRWLLAKLVKPSK